MVDIVAFVAAYLLKHAFTNFVSLFTKIRAVSAGHGYLEWYPPLFLTLLLHPIPPLILSALTTTATP